MLDYAGFVENTFYLDIMCLVQYGECLGESIWPALQKNADCTDLIAFLSEIAEAQKTIKFHVSRGKTHYDHWQDTLEKVCNR